MGCWSIARLPLTPPPPPKKKKKKEERALNQASLTICWNPFILLGGERHCVSKVSCPSTQHIDPAGLKPGILYQESSALTIRVLRLPAIGRTSGKCWYTTSNTNLPAKCKHQNQLFKQYPFKVWKFFYWKLPRGDCTLRYFFCNCQH